MSNVVPFETGAVPAHIAARFGDTANTDLSNGVGAGGFPIISYKGKVWHVVEGETRTLVAHEDGEPKSSIEVVVLKSNPHLSKIYYKGGYEEGTNAKPTCFSNNGASPDPGAQEPQSTTCAACPHNAWGSRVSEAGSKGKACSDSRRLAVAPVSDLERPMLLRVPAGSLKDLTAYADMLNRRKAPYNALVTKISFDHTVAHQKFVFKPTRWLTDSEAGQVQEVLAKDTVNVITGVDTTSAPLKIAGTPPKAAAPKPKLVAVEEPEEEYTPPVQAKPAAKKLDTAAVIAEVDASLDAALGMLDD